MSAHAIARTVGWLFVGTGLAGVAASFRSGTTDMSELTIAVLGWGLLRHWRPAWLAAVALLPIWAVVGPILWLGFDHPIYALWSGNQPSRVAFAIAFALASLGCLRALTLPGVRALFSAGRHPTSPPARTPTA